jgi:hypothetical protein
LLAVALSVGAAAGYFVVWSLNEGYGGCGPLGDSPAASTVKAAPFLLALAAVVIFLTVGAMRRWRPSTLVWGAVAIGATSGILEALVFWLEFLGHHCYA